MHVDRGYFERVDQAVVLVHADIDLPLRGLLATCRSTTGSPSWSGASPDPSPPTYS